MLELFAVASITMLAVISQGLILPWSPAIVWYSDAGPV